MSIEIKVPVLPESVVDAVVAGWYKKVGESVRRDETLVDLETDKVILEVPAISSGVIKELRFQEGEIVTANQVLAIIDETAVVATDAEPNNDSQVTQASDISSTPSISPSARKLMEQHEISPDAVTGSGKGGRVLKEDVQKLVSANNNKNDNNRAPPQQDKQATKQTPAPAEMHILGDRIEKRVPMTRLRSRIAERLLQAQHNAAILTTFNEVNMQPIMDLRSKYKEQFENEFGVKLGFMSFFVKASVDALKKFPEVNASIDGSDIVYHGFFDIGVAVSGPGGLVVPVLRDADKMSLAEIEANILAYSGKAKENALTIDEITGGTFTISNGGVFGSMLSTPILNPPQSAILGMHNIKQRAMVVNGDIVALPMMYLALSYDHRIIDGRVAVQFLLTIRDMLEDPARMMLGV